MRFVSAHDSFRRTIRFDVRSVSVYDPFQHAIRFGARFVSAPNSFRCPIRFGERFVVCAFRSARILFPLTSLPAQASNYSELEEPHLICFVLPAAFRVACMRMSYQAALSALSSH